MKLYKYDPPVVDLISFDDFIEATGMVEDQVYNKFMEDCDFTTESDGDFIVWIDLNQDELWCKLFKAKLPEDVVKRNKLGVEYCQ